MTTSALSPTEKTRVRLHPERAVYDRDALYRIIDEALVCHVGVAVGGQPRVIPTAILRLGEFIYIHGSPANQLLVALASGAPACITVTLIDSIVAGRSGFGMSMDYRSAMIFGTAEKIADPKEKERLVAAFVADICPGHQVRPPKAKELAATMFLRLALEEASVKIRDCGVVDPKEDHELDTWSGVIPLKLVAGTPRDCPDLKRGIAVPDYARDYRRG
jgi:nitroimidazol reductase NimA-like FMN-containing flavoprotein (pyridoxamine 5'-phosphate oxidase superfamily)